MHIKLALFPIPDGALFICPISLTKNCTAALSAAVQSVGYGVWVINAKVAFPCELLCNSLRGALYRRAPLSEKRSTGSFFGLTPAELLTLGSFALCGARPEALPLDSASF